MIILYPSYSFETLTADRTEDEAAELLASWSAAFHPALLERFNELPRWESASVPPYEVHRFPIIIPPSCESFLDENWFEHQKTGGAVHIRHLAQRQTVTEALLEQQELMPHGFDDDFVAGFYALGTAYFLVDILVRKLHYASLMDDSQLVSQIFDAIKIYRQGNREDAVDRLRQAFEVICTSKEYYYPTQTYFLDLTLLSPKVFGETFRQLLNTQKNANLFLPSKLLQELPEESPESVGVLKTAVEEGKIQFIADAHPALLTPLLPILDIAERILAGRNVYRTQINAAPSVFGTQRVCLNPLMPQLLKLARYKGVIHFAPRDGWKIKDNGHSKMIWQGVDGTKMDALVRYPLNASADLDFFVLAEQLGDTINSDHCPTAVFAQFPGVTKSQWLDDLRRMGMYVSALGNFTSVEQYFESTPQCGSVRKPGFDEYPETFLNDAEELNPVSVWKNIYQENIQRMIHSALQTLQVLLGGFKQSAVPPVSEILDSLVSFLIPNSPEVSSSPLQARLFFNPLSFPRKVYADVSDWTALPQISETVELAKEISVENSYKKEILVNVPPMGYAFVKAGEDKKTEEQESEKRKKEKKTAAGFRLRHFLPIPRSPSPSISSDPPMIQMQSDEIGKNAKRSVYILKNEFFEAKIDAVTGMLRSLFTPNSRLNRLSQQLGFRFPKAVRKEDFRNENDPNRGYAVSAADEIKIEHGALSSKVHINGRLVDVNGKTTAAFCETVIIRRRSRILEFELSLNEPVADETQSAVCGSAWDSYYTLRYAWNDSTLSFRGGLADGVHCIDDYLKIGSKLYAPRFVDLRNDDGSQSLTLFTEGCPFHRRFGERQLDTILVTGLESVRKFRFGIGVDVRNPAPASLEFLLPNDDLALSVTKSPKIPSAWFFQSEAKNVVALKWEIIPGEGKPAGLRVFLLETEGRRAHFAFHSFMAPKRAAATDFTNSELKEFKTDGDCVLLDMHGHELLPLNIWF